MLVWLSFVVFTRITGESSVLIHDTQSPEISQKQDRHNIYAIMKTICPLGHHHNGFVATHALGHVMYGYRLLFPMNQRSLLNLLSTLWLTGTSSV